MDFVVLSSSRGTTFQAVLDRIKEGSLRSRCLGLVSDREDRGCVAKARAAGVPTTVLPRSDREPRETYDKRLDAEIDKLLAAGDGERGRTVLAALGWMFILSPWFVGRWRNRILNVHPSLLPRHPGGHAVKDALDAGDRETGMTIHLIDEGVDTGPVLIQKTCPILPGDTVDSLKDRIQALEKEWYPKALEMIRSGELRLPS